MNPLIFPILSYTGYIVAIGIVLTVTIGIFRRTDLATYGKDWIRFGVLVGIGLLIAFAAALGRWWLFLSFCLLLLLAGES